MTLLLLKSNTIKQWAHSQNKTINRYRYNTTMKNITVLIAAFAFFISSCSEGNNKTEKLKAEIKSKNEAVEALRKEIAELETELGKLDSSKTNLGKPVKIVAVAINPFVHSIDIQGHVEAEESVTVGPQMPGLVKRVYVQSGDRVSAGQVLAEIDADAMLQSLSALKLQRDLAKQVFDRQKNLWDQKIGTEIQYLQSKMQYEALEKQIAATQEQIDMAKIKAPMAGTVDQVNIKAGEIAAAGYSGIVIVNTSKLRVKGQLAEGYISKVHTGNAVTVAFPDANKTIETKVAYSGQMINKMNRTFNVEVVLNPNEKDIVPNMSAMMKITDYKNDSAIVAPVSCIQQSSDGTLFVYVAVKNKEGKLIAEKRTVTYDNTYNGMAEIVTGLTTGDQLVTEGFSDLNPGDIILGK